MTRPHPMAEFVGHRGLAAEAPENTLEGAEAAARAGFEWIEIDVRLTADHVPVVSHDENLGRCFGLDLDISANEFGDLRREARALPRLDELLDLASNLGLRVNVEVKPCPGALDGGLKAVVDAVEACAKDPALVSSFSADVLGAYRSLAPAAALAWAMNELHPDWGFVAGKLGVGNVHLARSCAANGENRSIVRDAGYGLYVFTVNDSAEHEMLMANGVDGVFTDVSSLARSFPQPLPRS